MAEKLQLLQRTAAQGEMKKAIVATGANWKVVHFDLGSGAEVKGHTNPGFVTVTVLGGSGYAILGQAGEVAIAEGALLHYEPNEFHGFRADAEGLELVAHIIQATGASA